MDENESEDTRDQKTDSSQIVKGEQKVVEQSTMVASSSNISENASNLSRNSHCDRVDELSRHKIQRLDSEALNSESSAEKSVSTSTEFHSATDSQPELKPEINAEVLTVLIPDSENSSADTSVEQNHTSVELNIDTGQGDDADGRSEENGTSATNGAADIVSERPRESPESPTPSFDERSVTPGPTLQEVTVCTERWHTTMCRAPSPRYYTGTDVEPNLVEETEESTGDVEFSDKVPDLARDETDSSVMSDFGINDSSSSSSDGSDGSSSPTSILTGTRPYVDRLPTGSRRLGYWSSSEEGETYDVRQATIDAGVNEEAPRRSTTETNGRQESTSDATAVSVSATEETLPAESSYNTGTVPLTTNVPSNTINSATSTEGSGNDADETQSTQPQTTEQVDGNQESGDEDLRFIRGRLTGRRKRKMSTVKEPNPYITQPIPVLNWRSFSHMERLRHGEMSTEKYQREVQRSQHFIQRWDKECSLHGHRGCVNALNFNESGTVLVSAGDDLNVILWDWLTKKEKTKYESGHHSNVFQAKFLPHCNDTSVVSCARDGQIRHCSLSSTGTAYTTKLAQHKMSAHKLSVMRQHPCQLLTCGEDGYVFSLDVRVTYSKKPLPVLTVNDEKDRPIELYAIDCCPADENKFLVCGRSPNVLIYDRRNLHGGPLCKYRPKHISDDDFRMSATCAVYSNSGTEIVASYSDEDIYVFDADKHQIVCCDESLDELTPRSSQLTQEKSEEGQGNEDGDRKKGRLETTVDEPKKFFGHRNSQTVKGVNFYGPDSEYVVSGSDDGHVYVWDKHTTNIVQWIQADQAGVVNVLEPHPTLPLMATSGLDHCVKIWAPNRHRQQSSLVGLASTMAQNKKMRESDPNREGVFDARMLMLLMQSLSSSERRRMRLDDSEDEDEDEEDEEEDQGTGQREGSAAVGCRTS